MVFRRRFRGNSLRPVNRIKHVVDAQFATPLNTAVNTFLINTVDTPALANTDQVETGSTVNGIFLVIEAVNTGVTGVLANAYIMVYKNPGGNLVFPNPTAVGADDNKKFVIHQEMVMLQMQDNSNPRTLFKGVIVIPKHLRRNGPNDQLIVRAFAPGVETNWCMQAHYKEFR